MQKSGKMMFMPLVFVAALLLAACAGGPTPPTDTPGATAGAASPEKGTEPREDVALTPTQTVPPAPGATYTPMAITEAAPAASETPVPTPTAAAIPIPVTQELTFEPLAHEGGQALSVAVAGNVAYVGVGPRLVVLDVSNPARPQLIGRSEVLPGLVQALLVQRDVVYVGAGQRLVALDVGSGEEIRVQGSIELPGPISHLMQVEETLFAGGGVYTGPYSYEASGFLSRVAVTGPGELQILDTAPLPYAVRGLAHTADLLYVGLLHGVSEEVDLFVFDLSRGSLNDPTSVSLPVRDDVYSLQVVGDTLLVGGSMNLHAFDLASGAEDNRRQLTKLWAVNASPDLFLPQIEGMAVVDGFIYVVGNVPAGAYIPARLAVPPPEPLSGEPAPPTSPLVALSGNRLFVAEGHGLEIYDVSRPGEMEQVATYDSFTSSISSLAIGRPASGSEALYLYSGNPFDSSPEELFTFGLPGLERLSHLAIEPAETKTSVGQNAALDLVLAENQVYLVTADGVVHVDMSDPAFPQVVARYRFTEPWLNPRGLVARGGVVYLGQELESSVRVIAVDFNAGEAPRQIGALDGLRGENLRALAGAGDKLYVATALSSGEQSWLHVVDVSGEEMALLSSLPLPGYPEPVLDTDGTLLATAVDDRLLLADVSRPEHPAIVATVALPGSSAVVPFVRDLVFDKGLLFVTAGAELLAIDASNPAQPYAVGAIEVPSAPRSVVVSGQTVAVANSLMGVLVYRVGS